MVDKGATVVNQVLNYNTMEDEGLNYNIESNKGLDDGNEDSASQIDFEYSDDGDMGMNEDMVVVEEQVFEEDVDEE